MADTGADGTTTLARGLIDGAVGDATGIRGA
jgi:hypothetical protein